MKFLDKLKKTLWNSFFGKPERESKTRSKAAKKSKPARKKKPVKKAPPKLKLKKPAKIVPAKAAKVKPAPKLKVKPAPVPLPKVKQTAVKAPVRIKAQPKPALPASKPELPPGNLVGQVTHFFPQVKVAAIKIKAKNLSVGDEILIKGVTTNFKTKIDSMQINRVPVTQAPKGSEIGILVKKRVREGDEVFKL